MDKAQRIQDRDPPEYHLSQLNVQIREMMNGVLRPFDLKLVEWRLLQCLEEKDALSICDLANLAVIERTVTSRLVDRLIARGLVIKSQMPKDRRFYLVSLQPAGQALLDKCAGEVSAARARLFDGIDQQELGLLLGMLKRMQGNVVAFGEGPGVLKDVEVNFEVSDQTHTSDN